MTFVRRLPSRPKLWLAAGFAGVTLIGVACWHWSHRGEALPGPKLSGGPLQQVYCEPAQKFGAGLSRSIEQDSNGTVSVAWSGWIRASADGVHELDLAPEFRATVQIQHQRVIEDGLRKTHALAWNSGRYYAIRIVMPDNQSRSFPPLRWTLPNRTHQVIAQEHLFPSMATVVAQSN